MSTDAVLTGAWRLPRERRLAFFFANVSEQPVAATLRFDAKAYDIRARKLRLTLTEDGNTDPQTRELTSPFEQRIEFKPRSVQVWELGR